MVLPLYASLERLDRTLLDAAGDLYGSPWAVFRTVTLPLSLPGVVAGTLLTFVPATGDYINSQLLGSPATTMIGQVIDGQFLRVLDYPVAAALSVVLMVSGTVLVLGYVLRAGTQEIVG
jgi:spermidine/putrescine transport system permease protein